MAIQSNTYKIRLKNEYEKLQELPKNDLFKVEPAPGQTPPYVSSYYVTYNVPTWVKNSLGTLEIQKKTVVEVTKMSLSDAPHAKVVEGKVPYHTNWYTNGTVCNGNAWATPAMWLYEYIGFICELLQFRAERINPNSAANHEARDYWVKNKHDRTKFPTDTRSIPVPGQKKRIQIMTVTRK